MRTLPLLALALLFLFQNTALAQTSLTCSQNGTLITFTNGILTPKAGSEDNHDAVYYLETIKHLLLKTEIDKQGKVT